MASPHEKLAESLEVLRALQERGVVAVRSTELTRTHRERLIKNGFLQEVMKGWYIPSRPDKRKGDSTAWYASFWQFCAIYLTERFGEDWCLSPEQSLAIHSGNWTVPKQLLVRAPKAGNKVLNLPHRTSLLDVRASLPLSQDRVEKEGLRVFSIEASLIACHLRMTLSKRWKRLNTRFANIIHLSRVRLSKCTCCSRLLAGFSGRAYKH